MDLGLVRPCAKICRLLVAVLLVTACGGSAAKPSQRTAEDYVASYGGLTGVYRSILAETDCGTLQDEFDLANDHQSLGFMVAIDDRMTALSCP